MAQTATIVGTLNLPAEDGATPSPISLALSLIFAQKTSALLEYDAPVTAQTVDLGTLTSGGAKLLLLKCTMGTLSVSINTSTAIQLTALFGYVLIANTQQGVVTSLTVTTTNPAVLKVEAYA